MNLELDIEILGWLLVGLGIEELVLVVTALGYGEPVLPYLASALLALVFGLPIVLSHRAASRQMHPRDGFLVVGSAWIVASVFGAFPYVLSGTLGPVDALFESAAGFTTTGASVMTDIGSAPHALLLWRAMTQWNGGMGIIVFAVAVLPLLGIGGMQLFNAEVPGPVKDKLTPRVAVTARRLWLIYLGFTAAAALALWAAGMGPFDAVCHAFTTLSTGGFSTRSESVAAFGSPLVEWIIVAFMLVASINFVLHYRALIGQPRAMWRDQELRLFLGLTAGAALLISLNLAVGAGPGEEDVRRASFQVVSIVTTTGFSTADFEAWPSLSQLVLVHLMVLGGMAGSTAGGIKTLRALIGVRVLRSFLSRSLHPRSVRTVKHGGQAVAESVVAGVGVFFIAYAVLAVAAAGVVAFAGYDLLTALTASISALSNVGPGLGAVGPTEHYAHLPSYAKLALGFCMIAGRLELFTVLVLLHPRFWRL